MKRPNRRSAAVLLVGAAMTAAPMALATVVTPAVSSAECVPGGGGASASPVGASVGGGEVKCTTAAAEEPANNEPKNEWGFNPNLTPAENLANLPAPQLSEPLVQTSLIDDVPVEVAPTLGLPGIGVGVNLWPDLTPIVNGVTGAAVGAALPSLPAPQLPNLAQLPPPQLPDLTQIPPPQAPPRLIPQMCGPQITPFFTPCI